MVVKRGTNDSEIVPMARHFKGSRRGAALHRIHGRRHVERLEHGRSAAVAPTSSRASPSTSRSRRSKRTAPPRPRSAGAIADGGGEIGVISSVTRAFCGDCTRARLSTEGKLYLCLFASSRPRPARAGARRRERRRHRHRDRRNLAGARRPLLATARQRHGRCHARGTAAASKCRTSAAESAAHDADARTHHRTVARGRPRHAHGRRRQGPADAARRAARAHVLKRLAPQTGALLISANRTPTLTARSARRSAPRWSRIRCPTFRARSPACLPACAPRRAATCSSAPCDSPCLPADLAERLAHALDANGRRHRHRHHCRTSPAKQSLHPVFALLAHVASRTISAPGWCR